MNYKILWKSIKECLLLLGLAFVMFIVMVAIFFAPFLLALFYLDGYLMFLGFVPIFILILILFIYAKYKDNLDKEEITKK